MPGVPEFEAVETAIKDVIARAAKRGVHTFVSAVFYTPAEASPLARSTIRNWMVRSDVDVMKFTRITVNPRQMGGMPCVRGLRIPVATVVGMVADGMTEADIVKAYPDLEAADIHEALQYAAEAVRERELPLAAP
jgi:uncharacterized protein (DUF433 family)